jgi:hypothetical protein
MKCSLLCFSSLIFIFSSISVSAETKVYYWVDEQGKSHFSDTASPKAEEITVNNQNLLFNNKTDGQKTEMKNEETPVDNKESQAAIEYQATIISPQDDTALRSNDGTINIFVSTTPEKNDKQKLQLFLDGKALGAPQISPTMRALNIDRGTHQVQVHLLDEDGKLLAKTQIVTVHLLRANVGIISAAPK